MQAPPVRFARVLIEELFGPESRPIDVRLRLDERVTVLHGRNGSGKTLTLSLLASLLRGEFHALGRIPFHRLMVDLTDGSRIEFEQHISEPRDALGHKSIKQNAAQNVARSLSYRLYEGDAVVTAGVIGPPDRERFQRRMRRLAPWLRQIDDDAWSDERTGQLMTLDQALEAYDFALAESDPEAPESREHAELHEFCQRLPRVKLVRTDRLFAPPRLDQDASRPTFSFGRPFVIHRQLMVERLSNDIRSHVQEADKSYRLKSTQLDGTLTQRLVEPTIESDVSLDELRARYAALQEQEGRLRALGLIRGEAWPPVRDESFLEKNRQVLAISLGDKESKLEPFRKLADRAQRLLDTLNKKLAPKSVRLDVETGYHVTTASGGPLSLDSLSSGEQHELVLLHELLFEAQPGSLILIDEPELSLHVTWQVEFLPDLLAIADLSKCDFILATHSPYIVGDHPELMVRLGEPLDVDA